MSGDAGRAVSRSRDLEYAETSPRTSANSVATVARFRRADDRQRSAYSTLARDGARPRLFADRRWFSSSATSPTAVHRRSGDIESMHRRSASAQLGFVYIAEAHRRTAGLQSNSTTTSSCATRPDDRSPRRVKALPADEPALATTWVTPSARRAAAGAHLRRARRPRSLRGGRAVEFDPDAAAAGLVL